ncbi:GspE/PulE family protein [bacterium]|nr:GspE/PulE family protein [bacterium]
MADPIKKTLNNKYKSEEAAKAKNKDLVTRGGLPKAQDRADLQKYMDALGTESAARMQEEAIDTGLVTTKDEILDQIAADLGMEKVLLNKIEFTPDLIQQVPANVAKKFGVLPVGYNDYEVELALSDPHNVQALDDLARVLGKNIRGRVAMQEDIERLIKKFYDSDDVSNIYAGMTETEEPAAANRWEELTVGGDKEQAEQPAVIKFVDLIFKQAVHERASDIHIEPHRFGVTIRFRIDGVLHEVPSPPRKWQNNILSRLKVMSGMDLAEKRVPQDGRIRLSLPDKKLDLRVSSLPTIFGESVVMRILDQSQVMMGLQDVGFTERSVSIFKRLIKQPNGVILMTGPTGSGKTTTLYAALGSLNTPEEKLVTLEDPVEYMIPGINQIQINHDIGLTFAAGLRAVLRQSPDVILVGEIRDLETAENAIRAALTGHLVFSTLHTNDAPSSTIRLIDMGIKPYLVARSLQAAIAQRLVRRICTGCKTAYHPPAEAIAEMGFDPEEFKNTDFFHGKGCERCNQGGYRGRTAIHEIMVMDPDLRRRVIRSESASRLKKAAVAKGMFTLRRDGWEKILRGQTTIEEVMRITAADEE